MGFLKFRLCEYSHIKYLDESHSVFFLGFQLTFGIHAFLNKSKLLIMIDVKFTKEPSHIIRRKNYQEKKCYYNENLT